MDATNQYYDRQSGSWRQPSLSAFEAKATGRLIIEIVPEFGHDGRVHRWSDRKAGTLEERLGEVLAGIDTFIAYEGDRRRRAEAEQERRNREHEAALERARERERYQQRVGALTAQLQNWKAANDIRRYCREAAKAHPNSEVSTEWLVWASAYADSIDPLRSIPSAPM